MKKIFFAALAATTLLAACSKEDNGTASEGAKAKLKVTVSTSSRAGGEGAAGDATITGYNLFVFDAAGNNIGYTTGSSGTETVETTTSAKEVYVIANSAGLTLSDATTKAALLALTNDLDDATNNQRAKRWATGSATIGAFTQDASGDFEASVSVNMKFITARIQVSITNSMSNYVATSTTGSFVLKGVSVLNATAASKLFGSSLVSGTAYYAGIDMTGFENVPASYSEKAFLKDAIASGVANPNGYHYYVFENAATAVDEFPTIVVVEGTYGPAAQPVYFPVHLAAYESFASGGLTASVERGKSYDLAITLKGDAGYTAPQDYPGGTGGTDDPTVPSVKLTLTIGLSITDWVPVVLAKEFD